LPICSVPMATLGMSFTGVGEAAGRPIQQHFFFPIALAELGLLIHRYRSASATQLALAVRLILRFKKRCNSRIVRDDKVCVCRTAQPPAARSQTPLQGGSAPVDPREDRSERTR
jgi:hypothetical protein